MAVTNLPNQLGEHGAPPLAALAINTGGAYLATETISKKSLRQLIDEMTTYYEASYVPADAEPDGRFHPITVKPLRAALVIHSRAGYLSTPSGQGEGLGGFDVPLLKVLAGPELPSQIGFRANVLPLGARVSQNSGELVVEVPIANLEMRKDVNTNLFSVHLAMTAQIKNATGQVIDHFGEDVSRRGVLEDAETTRTQCITLQRRLTAPPGTYSLEVAVVDVHSGAIGAQKTSFSLEGAPSALAVGGPILVRRTETLTANDDLLEPLRYGGERIVPDLAGTLPPKSKAIRLFFVVHPDPLAAEPPKASLRLLKDGNVVSESPVQLVGTSKGDIPYLGSLQSPSFPSGSYELQTVVTQAGKTTSPSVDFTIDRPELASAGAPPGFGADRGAPGPDGVAAHEAANTGLDLGTATHPVVTRPEPRLAPPVPPNSLALLEAARKQALDYSHSLPNFTCVEVTNRSVDPSGNGHWQRSDSLAERLSYRDGQESRSTIAINGKATQEERGNLLGAFSNGEFGEVLKTIFDPAAKADFKWNEAAEIRGEAVQVFTYSVPRSSSTFTLSAGQDTGGTKVGFHGQVFIDQATRGIRRVTLEAEPPQGLSIHATTITVDYDYISINSHEYLLPVAAAVAVRSGRKQSMLNEIEFRDYRRFGSQVKLLAPEQDGPR